MKNKLPSIKVQGGAEYIMVKDRVAEFHRLYPIGSITTEIISNTETSVIVKATVWPDAKVDLRYFTGHAESYTNAKGVEGQKPLEVAETSSIGRAMAALNIGVIESYASADEIASVKTFGRTTGSKLATEKQKEYLQKMLVTKGLNFLTDKELETLTMDEASKLIEKYKYKSKSYGANDRDFTADEEGGNKQDAIDESRQENYEIINRDK